MGCWLPNLPHHFTYIPQGNLRSPSNTFWKEGRAWKAGATTIVKTRFLL